MYRGSVAEMVVPYGDPGASWFFRNSFDVGELGLGKAASPLRQGLDCPENAQLFDAVMAGDRGEALRLRQVAALYEVDAGIAWKHNDETRRARNLVLMFVASVGNYDYEFSWIFHQDGTLEMKVGLTGIMSVKAEKDHDPANGHMVAPALSAVHHQHFFSFRLDLDVDGATPNRVVELNTEAEPAFAVPGPGRGDERADEGPEAARSQKKTHAEDCAAFQRNAGPVQGERAFAHDGEEHPAYAHHSESGFDEYQREHALVLADVMDTR